MQQCKALIKKEFQTTRAKFLMPAYVTAVIYILVLLGWISSLIWGQGVQFNIDGPDNFGAFAGLGSLLVGTVITIVIGFISTGAVLGISETVLNTGRKMRCEIMHYSQPVSFAKIMGSKYAYTTVGSILLFGALSLVSCVVFALLAHQFMGSAMQYPLAAWLQTWLQMSLRIFIVASTMWLFAGIFKHSAFGMLMLTLIVITAVTEILNYTTGWKIPSLSEYFIYNLLSYGEVFRIFDMAETIIPGVGSKDLDLIARSLGSGWGSLLSWHTLVQLAYSALAFIGGSLLYKRRELQ